MTFNTIIHNKKVHTFFQVTCLNTGNACTCTRIWGWSALFFAVTYKHFQYFSWSRGACHPKIGWSSIITLFPPVFNWWKNICHWLYWSFLNSSNIVGSQYCFCLILKEDFPHLTLKMWYLSIFTEEIMVQAPSRCHAKSSRSWKLILESFHSKPSVAKSSWYRLSLVSNFNAFNFPWPENALVQSLPVKACTVHH